MARLKFKISESDRVLLPVAVLILLVAAFLRTQPHIANATPFFAISILVGFLLGAGRGTLAVGLSVAAMFLADAMIGFHSTMIFVYVGVAIAASVGSLAEGFLNRDTSNLAARGSAKNLARHSAGGFLASAVASTMFFVVSNFGVWLVGGLYPRTLAGLVTCFEMAVPFFRNSLTTDVFFGTIFISLACIVRSYAVQRVSYGR